MLTRLVDLAYNTNSSQGLLEPDSMDSYLFTKVVTNYSDITIVFTLSNAPDLLNRHLVSGSFDLFKVLITHYYREYLDYKSYIKAHKKSMGSTD